MGHTIEPVRVGNALVGPGHPTYVIAEIGINHNGDTDLTKKLIDIAANAGAHAVKFQTRTIPVVYSPQDLQKPRPDIVEKGLPYLKNAITRRVIPAHCLTRLETSNFKDGRTEEQKYMLEFTDYEYGEIDAYCAQVGIAWSVSCWDVASVERMEQFNLPFHKIASPCNEDDDLLVAMRATGRPLIFSTGMSTLESIRVSIGLLGGTDNLILMNCTSVYPQGTSTPELVLPLVNLRGIGTLREAFGVPVGQSSHDTGIVPTYAAVAQGADLIEKHITIERGMYGSDQAASVEPDEFARLCQWIRDLQLANGDGKITIYPDEQAAINKLRRVRRVI